MSRITGQFLFGLESTLPVTARYPTCGVLVLRHLPTDEVARTLNFGMDGLLVPQCHDGIEARRAARRDVAGGEGDERQQKGDFQKRDGIAGADAEKQTSEQARER
jgi:hypothetical protein